MRTNQRCSFDVLGSGGNQMGAQICTLHGSSTNSTVALAHSLMSLRTLAAQSYRSFSSSLISDHMAVAHYWQRLLDEGKFRSITDIASAEGINVTQARRLLRLMLLAPTVVEKLLANPDVAVNLGSVLRRVMPLDWQAQGAVVPADPKLTTHADCALTSICRAVVNRRSAQPAEAGQIRIGGNTSETIKA